MPLRQPDSQKEENKKLSTSRKQAYSYWKRFIRVDYLSIKKKKIKLEIYPKKALLFQTVADNSWCISHFSQFRDFANVKGIFILESNFN